MRIDEKKTGTVLVVKPLEKRLDASYAPEFKGFMIDRINAGNKRILLNLSEVDFIDSSGLGAIVSSLKALKNSGDLAVCELRETVASLFRLTRMDHVFQVFSTEEDGAKAL